MDQGRSDRTRADDSIPAGRDPQHTLLGALRPLLDAIRIVETGGQADPAGAVGDGGRSLGPYQISRAYWLDACERSESLRGQPYATVRDVDYAERVMIAYWQRYCPVTLRMVTWQDPAMRCHAFEVLARIHNGGPNGAHQPATLDYWRRVEAELSRRS